MTRTEVTSARIAKIAGRILAIEDEPAPNQWRPSWKEIRAMAASVQKPAEITSGRVAKVAGRVLGADRVSTALMIIGCKIVLLRGEDIKAMAGSLVNQAADKPSIRFHHWGNEPGEAPGPKRKNGRVKVGPYRYRKRTVLKKGRRAK